MAVIESKCSCGQPVEVRTGSDSGDSFRSDGKQAVYPGETGYNIFRCRACLQPLHDTCSDFSFADKGSVGTKAHLAMTIRRPKSSALGTEPWVMLEDDSGSGVAVAMFGPDSPSSRADAFKMMRLWNAEQ
jgi:hypothetical protein